MVCGKERKLANLIKPFDGTAEQKPKLQGTIDKID